MTQARAFNRAYGRDDMTWADLIALGGVEQDRTIRSLPSDQLEAVLETREFNQQIERSL